MIFHMTNKPRMRCYLLIIRCLRTKCCLVIFVFGFVLLIGKMYQQRKSLLVNINRNSDESDIIQGSDEKKLFVPGLFLQKFKPQNISYCHFGFGLPDILELTDNDVKYTPEMGADSKYRIVYNVLEPSYNGSEADSGDTVTYCTHATPEFIYYLAEVLKRWEGPLSVATFVPGTDASLTVCLLERLCSCFPSMSRVALHFIFPVNYPPQLSACPAALVLPKDCTAPTVLLTKKLYTFRSRMALTYPVNVARNAARFASQTPFILVSDVELLPSRNLVTNFMKMIHSMEKKSGMSYQNFADKLVYVIPVFEVVASETVPDVKSKLLDMYTQNRAFYFHRWVCSHCQRFPGLPRWLLKKSPTMDNIIQPFFVVRREFPFHRWEPVFIGTNTEPLYSEVLTWEGQQDKMTQMHEMCLLRYHFVILDGAFLVHAPGVKRKADVIRDSWRSKLQRENSLKYDLIIKSVSDRYKYNSRCKITNGKNWKNSRTPSPSKCATSSVSEQGGEMECEESGLVIARAEVEDDSSAGKVKNSKQAPDTAASIPSVITCSETPPLSEVQIIESSVAHDKTSQAVKEGNHIFGRITETAAKYLPKKSNFSKIFGEKETDIKISTIDREMAKHTPKLRSNHHYATEFSNSELTDRLRRTKLPNADENISRCKSVGCLAIDYPPHRLYFLPCEDWRDPDSVINTLVRIILSQVALIIFLLLWILFGALLFYLTEGPYEYKAALESEKEEKSLALSLATDLRLVNPEESSWTETIDKYTALHRQVIIKAVVSSYGKQKFFWTYPGSLLFATSLLTTCGISTPLPMTEGGKIGAFVFTILGVPMHLMLLVNLGRTVALKLQILAKDVEIKFYELRRWISNVRKFGEDLGRDKDKWPEKIFIEEFKPPEWLCHLPLLIIFLYYLFGCIIFGSFEDFSSFCLFPIIFSSTNYHSTDLARFGYACYLEGLAVLISVNIALWRDSPYEGFVSIGTSLRFMTNSID